MEFAKVSVESLHYEFHLYRPGIPFYILLGFFGLVALFFLFFFITCLCERQHLTGDVEPVAEPFPYPPTPYWKTTCADALKCGLQHAGDFATRKDTSLVKGLMSLFVSPERHVIAAVVSGSITVARTRKTVLRSRLANGQILESCDQAGIEDLSGVVDRAILVNAGIVELLMFHNQRIRESGVVALPFNPGPALEEYERMDQERGERWVRLGMARWADPGHATLRMTLRGAIGMVQKMFQQTQKVSGQEKRARIKRAGSRPGD
jgi:hypothetical protein